MENIDGKQSQNSISEVCLIDKTKLNTEFYFQSLLDAAASAKLLSNEDIERLQYDCLELLAAKTSAYTGGDSSSVPMGVAENIMKSNLFTIGVGLKGFETPENAVKALLKDGADEQYKRGTKRLNAKLKTAHYFHELVIKNMVQTELYDYNATLVGGIMGFFKLYNPDYEAHEIHITADYPLLNPIENLAGIEFIEKYLESIYYENIFCNCFSSETIHALLRGYWTDEHYQELLFNMLEPIMTTAIGCTLMGVNAEDLRLSKQHIELLKNMLKDKSQNEITTIITTAFEKLLAELAISASSAKRYYLKALPDICGNIFNAAQSNRLDRAFIVAV